MCSGTNFFFWQKAIAANLLYYIQACNRQKHNHKLYSCNLTLLEHIFEGNLIVVRFTVEKVQPQSVLEKLVCKLHCYAVFLEVPEVSRLSLCPTSAAASVVPARPPSLLAVSMRETMMLYAQT